MAKTEDLNMEHFVWWKSLDLLSASIASMLLAAPAFALTDTERINQLEKEVSEMTSGMANRSGNGDGLPLHGFLDIGYASNNYEDVAVKLHGFNVGLLDFYLTPQFSDNVKSLVELVFEVDAHGAVVADFERAQVGYTLNDKMTLWGGRFHTPYGYWNTAFHNGAEIQTSVLRPRFLAFGDRGGVLPAHMVGLWATGKTGGGEGKITYDAFAGNGPKLVGVTGPGTGAMDANMAGDNNHNAMVGLNVGYEFSGRLDGLRLAAHGFRGTVDAYDPADVLTNSTGLNMLGGSAVYLANDWEVMSEYYHFSNKDKSGTSITPSSTYKSQAAYLQVGREINRMTPFVRLERAILNQNDNYFGDQETGRAYSREAIGLSYRLNQKAALKFELLNSKFEADAIRGTGRFNSILAQYAIRF
jgi:hypothetical protein